MLFDTGGNNNKNNIYLLAAVNVDFKRYPSTYCLSQVNVLFRATFKIKI